VGYWRGTTRKPPAQWGDVELARTLNGYLGTNLAPWQLAELPELWIAMIVRGMGLRGEMEEKGLV